MRSSMRRFVTVLILIFAAALCRADISPDIVAKGKDATAFVDVGGGKTSGSAFCIDAAGYFVTNEHVVSDAAGGSKVLVVVHSGDKSQKAYPAAVVRVDKEADLALLKVDSKVRFHALSLGNTDGLAETQPVVAFGYPFGQEITPNSRDYPAVSINTGHITALRASNGKLTDIQIDAVINHGNSGGPVINDRGEVIGIAASIIEGSGIAFAIPVSRLHGFLDRTVITIKPGSLSLERLSKPQEFAVAVDTFRRSNAPIDVTLTLSAEGRAPRAFVPTTSDGHTFRVATVPLPADADKRLLDLTVTDKTGDLFFRSKDRTLLVGNIEVPLSVVQRLVPGSAAEALLRDGRKLHGPIKGLESIPAVIGGTASSLNLNQAERILVDESSPPATAVGYEIVARQGGKEIARKTGVIDIDRSRDALSGAAKPIHGLLLLVCCSATNIVKCYDGNTGAFVEDFVQGNGLATPYGCAFGPDGNLYVGAANNCAVHRFDGHTGQFMNSFATGHDISGIEGMVFGPDGNLYLTNRGTDEVLRFNGRTGAFIDIFVSRQSGGLQIPWGLTFGPDRNLYVASYWTHQIKCYDGKTGAFLRDFAGANGLAYPINLTFGPDGNLYVASKESDEVKRFNGKTGEFIDNFISKGSGNLQKPLSVTFGPDGNLYVGSSTANPVKRYNGRTGAYIDDFVPSTGGASLDPVVLIFHNARR